MHQGATAHLGARAPLGTGVESTTAAALRAHLLAHGGFTIDPRGGQHLLGGIAVAADPSRSLVLDADRWDDVRLERWLSGCERWLGETDEHGPLHLGGWFDPVRRAACFDLVRVFPRRCRDEALALARRLRQHAVYDLDAGCLVIVAEAAAGVA